MLVSAVCKLNTFNNSYLKSKNTFCSETQKANGENCPSLNDTVNTGTKIDLKA